MIFPQLIPGSQPTLSLAGEEIPDQGALALFENDVRRDVGFALKRGRDFLRQSQERHGLRAVGPRRHDRLAGVGGLADARHQRDFAQKGRAHFSAVSRAPPWPKMCVR